MKNTNRITTLTVIPGVISLICLLGYSLALHDIYYDYASPKVLQEQAHITPETLPEWTACPLEWRIVSIGFWLILVFHIVFFAHVIYSVRSRNNQSKSSQDTQS